MKNPLSYAGVDYGCKRRVTFTAVGWANDCARDSCFEHSRNQSSLRLRFATVGRSGVSRWLGPSVAPTQLPVLERTPTVGTWILELDTRS